MGGALVSLLAFAGALVYLFRFTREVLGGDRVAQTATWLLATYPFALWYGVPYTESLFLLEAVGAFYHFRRDEYAKAGAWGLLVGLTRPNGCFLSIPLAVMAVAPWFPGWLRGGPPAESPDSPVSGGHRPAAALAHRLAAAALPGVGVLLYSAYVWQLTGNPLSWAEGHVA
ncbi:MAG: hypothetical protein FJW27_18830 [Acidimicrobiia bacterium]|nr:hypothetical protein [Acidimicrobiia bacterium]